jgi:hypothetical protein
MKLKVQAQHLQPGDIVGSGEMVIYVGAGISTPNAKVNVVLRSARGDRPSIWGKYTMINIERPEKAKWHCRGPKGDCTTQCNTCFQMEETGPE